MSKPRNHDAAFKARVALEVLQGERTVAELAAAYSIHPTMVHRYIPMRRGVLYLVEVMDWHTRKVLAWRTSNTQETDVCVEALNETIHRFGAPDIMNTDQGSQFASFVWIELLKRAGTRILMDGKGRCIDNVLIERLWRSLKYECVDLHAKLAEWEKFYNLARPHAADNGKRPYEAL
jgi:putative transposase